jgi:hypothetical protein
MICSLPFPSLKAAEPDSRSSSRLDKMNHFVDTDPRRCHRSTETSLSPGECFDDTEDAVASTDNPAQEDRRTLGDLNAGRLERSRCGGGRIRVFLSRRFLRLPQ